MPPSTGDAPHHVAHLDIAKRPQDKLRAAYSSRRHLGKPDHQFNRISLTVAVLARVGDRESDDFLDRVAHAHVAGIRPIK